MLRLVKRELNPTTEQRLTRMMMDVIALRRLDNAELRAGYDALEAVRDALSLMLDRTDGKHV